MNVTCHCVNRISRSAAGPRAGSLSHQCLAVAFSELDGHALRRSSRRSSRQRARRLDDQGLTKKKKPADKRAWLRERASCTAVAAHRRGFRRSGDNNHVDAQKRASVRATADRADVQPPRLAQQSASGSRHSPARVLLLFSHPPSKEARGVCRSLLLGACALVKKEGKMLWPSTFAVWRWTP